MKTIHLHRSILLIIALLVVTMCIAGMHIISLSHQLDRSDIKITALEGQIARIQSSRCSQAYEWTSDASYPYVIESSGGNRTYTVHTPTAYIPQQKYPVIVVFDGMNGSSTRAEALSGLSALPAILVYPDALIGTNGSTAWQGAPYSPKDVNDVQFVDTLLDRVGRDYCTDSERTYMVGMSNGAGFALTAACQLGKRVTAVVGISGAFYTRCPTSAPLDSSLLLIHSTNDKNIPFTGNSARKLPNIYQLALSTSRAAGCKLGAVKNGSDIQKMIWSNCRDSQIIELLVIDRQRHGWLAVTDESIEPKGALSRQTTSAVIWEFFNGLNADR